MIPCYTNRRCRLGGGTAAPRYDMRGPRVICACAEFADAPYIYPVRNTLANAVAPCVVPRLPKSTLANIQPKSSGYRSLDTIGAGFHIHIDSVCICNVNGGGDGLGEYFLVNTICICNASGGDVGFRECILMYTICICNASGTDDGFREYFLINTICICNASGGDDGFCEYFLITICICNANDGYDGF